MFPHRNIHKYTWNYPDGKTHNQIDHTSINRRQHSSILNVLSFREADCDTDHYLVAAKVKKRFDLRKLNELEVTKQFHNKISNIFPALES
jgi:hypothetical protein